MWKRMHHHKRWVRDDKEKASWWTRKIKRISKVNGLWKYRWQTFCPPKEIGEEEFGADWLHYDVALRLAYSLSKSGKNLMPRDYLYLHAAPYNSAKILARAINEKSPVPGRQSGDYLSQIFGCGSCDPAQKEYILCDKHKEIEDPEKLQLLLKRCFSED